MIPTASLQKKSLSTPNPYSWELTLKAMKINKLLTIVSLLMIVLFAGCEKDDFQETIGICPLVLSTDPADGDANVPLDKVITVTFNEDMNPATLTQGGITIEGQSEITGTITYDQSTLTASFTPSSELTANTTYAGRVKTSVKDVDGNALQEDYVWTFSTGATVSPMVIATDPENGETNVVLNKVITATFSQSMDPLTINENTFTIMNGGTAITGTVAYSGTTASFTPAENLGINTVFTATITTGAENSTGIALLSDYIWEFTTGTSVAPTVTSTDPQNDETDVALAKTINATFSESMDPTTINDTTFTLKQGTKVISGAVSYTGITASFNPDINLEANKLYTATITTGAENTSGIGLENDYTWSFTTTATAGQSPDLGTIENFGGFGGNAGITNQGLNTVINNGGIGTTAASTLVTGFHDGLTGDIYTETPLNEGLVTGGIFTAPPSPGTAASFEIAEQALLDAQALYNAISPAAMPGGSDPGAGELGGLVLPPGIYQSASGTFNISNGDLTLDAQGDPDALWVFQTASGLTVGIAGPTGAKNVILVNGANAANVFWQVGSAATINAAGGGTMVGTIVSMQGVTFSTAGNAAQTVLDGRAISLVASVTMVNTTINVPN